MYFSKDFTANIYTDISESACEFFGDLYSFCFALFKRGVSFDEDKFLMFFSQSIPVEIARGRHGEEICANCAKKKVTCRVTFGRCFYLQKVPFLLYCLW